jgi:uncharacterized protein
MRVFLDANVLFSGAQAGSPMRQLLDTLGHHCCLVAHPIAIDEARRNIALKRPAWMPGLHSLETAVEVSELMGYIPAVDLAEKDRPILRAAVGGRCTHLLTGDLQHFRHLFGETVAGVRIVSPRLLVQEVQSLGWVE